MSHSSALVLLLLTALLAPTLQQINYQPEESDREYCYHESTELGLCLGRQQQTQIDLTDDVIFDCIQCSGPYRGDETCSELKALNNSTSNITVLMEKGEELSFCQTYNYCVQTKCPPQCWKEHVRWLECVIVELDCDLGCQSAEHGGGFVGEEIVLGISNSGKRKGSGAARLFARVLGLWFVSLLVC